MALYGAAGSAPFLCVYSAYFEGISARLVALSDDLIAPSACLVAPELF